MTVDLDEDVFVARDVTNEVLILYAILTLRGVQWFIESGRMKPFDKTAQEVEVETGRSLTSIEESRQNERRNGNGGTNIQIVQKKYQPSRLQDCGAPGNRRKGRVEAEGFILPAISPVEGICSHNLDRPRNDFSSRAFTKAWATSRTSLNER
ncbi:hypothetical protein B0H11DRAFT_1907350 [Mycena galericulata]|nr:hypothetical protein B0H11DRAFT_1907350 [Mycena galericulata]